MSVADNLEAEEDTDSSLSNELSSIMEDADSTPRNQSLAVNSSVHRGKVHFIDDRMIASMDKCKLSSRDAMHFITATVGAI